LSLFSARSAHVAAAATVAMLLSAGAIIGCSSGSNTQKTVDLSSGPSASATPEANPTPRVIVVATPAVWPTPWATFEAGATRTPVAISGTRTPTAALTPVATATPAPISQLPNLASGLDDKLVALTQALGSQDADQSLRAQKDLLAEADKVEQALEIDKSAQADLVRQAIQDVRNGANGDLGKLDSARSKLRVASGDTSSIAQSAPGAQGPQAMAASLQTKLKSLNDAKQQNRLADLLRLQQDILSEVDQDQKAIVNQHTNSADSLRGALQDLKDGLGGETSKLDSAAAALTTISSSSPSATTQPGGAGQQLQTAAASLDNKVSLLQQALSGGSRDDLLRAQRELLDEVSRDQSLVNGNGAPAADRLRSALSQAKDGASGDAAKLNGARSDLSGLVGGQQAASGQSQSGQSTAPAQAVDLPSMANDLSRNVDSYKQAVDKGDRASMLRLQQQLTDQVNKADQAVKNGSGQQYEQMRSALGDLTNALQGDLSKLNSANAGLRLVAGGSQPSSSLPATGSQSSSQQASQATQDAARQLNSTMAAVEMAMQSGNADDVARAQKALQEADDAAQKLPPDQASQIRSAIGDAREALSGDKAKLDSARKQIQQLIPR
jgi:hypothetical protein